MNKIFIIITLIFSAGIYSNEVNDPFENINRKTFEFNENLDLEICGLGGERMKKEGVKILQDTTSISAIWIWEALPLIIPTLIIQKRFYKLLKNFPPDCLILIDYMGPNIKIGTKLKRS